LRVRIFSLLGIYPLEIYNHEKEKIALLNEKAEDRVCGI
jgi:hypothetical protein